MEVNDVVVDVVDVRVEMVVEDELIDDPIRFSTYHQVDFGHRY